MRGMDASSYLELARLSASSSHMPERSEPRGGTSSPRR